MTSVLPVREDRLWDRLKQLSEITDPGPGVTRRAFSDAFLRGRAWVAEAFTAAGLDVAWDHAGNLHGVLAGSSPQRILLGGHSDTVPHGGAFDGALGVLSALEILQSIREADITPRHTLHVVDCLAEEPTLFGLSCIGSRGFVGALNFEDLDRTDPDGTTLAEALRRAGGDPDLLGPVMPETDIKAFLELHIEQGPRLEACANSLGVVSGIAGIIRFRLHVQGTPGHAGTVPMPMRRDALVAASRAVALIHDRTAAIPGLVSTVGRLVAEPNVANVIPGKVEAWVEFRAADAALLARHPSEIMQEAADAGRSGGCDVSYEAHMDSDPVNMDEHLIDVLSDAIKQRGMTPVVMPSGAGHDATQMARRTQVAMLFSPCRGGLSHCPEEWVERSDVARALAVYSDAVAALSIAEEGPHVERSRPNV